MTTQIRRRRRGSTATIVKAMRILAGDIVNNSVASGACLEAAGRLEELAALAAQAKNSKRMESALKVIDTWAQFGALDPEDVHKLCLRALGVA